MLTRKRSEIRKQKPWQALVIGVALALLSLHALLMAQPPQPPIRLALAHVTVIDVTRGSTEPDMMVLLAGDRI